MNKEAIVDEAIALLNDEGLDGISLRKLASRLDMKAPSLYHHFRDKSALLSAVMEKIFNSCLDAVPDHTDWAAWMRAYGEALWTTQHSVRDFGRLVTTTNMDDAQFRRTYNSIRRRLARLDLPEDEAMRLQSTIQALITGWSAYAHAPYADALAKLLPFKEMAINDVELIIAGEKLRRSRVLGRRRSPRKASAR